MNFIRNHILFAGLGLFSLLSIVSCSPDCNLPLRDPFSIYIVNGSGQDIFALDPSLNKDSVYMAVVKSGTEQPATRSVFSRELVGADTFNVFFNPDIPDLNVSSDTQTVFLYFPHGRKEPLQLITYDEVADKCGAVLRIGKVLQGSAEAVQTEGYYKIIQ